MYNIDFNKPLYIHFIGIGGISMSGLAQILLEKGFTVSGSDSNKSNLTSHLAELGAKIYFGQRASNITPDVQLVVYTALVRMGILSSVAAIYSGLSAFTAAV